MIYIQQESEDVASQIEFVGSLSLESDLCDEVSLQGNSGLGEIYTRRFLEFPSDVSVADRTDSLKIVGHATPVDGLLSVVRRFFIFFEDAFRQVSKMWVSN
jgi:hypothetical protein